jgi:phosphatidate cytidylyltransferase
MNDNINFRNSLYRVLSSLVLITLALFSIYISGSFLIFILASLVFIMTYEWVTITENINTILLKSTKSLFNVIIFMLSLLSIKFSIIFYIFILLLNLFARNTEKTNKIFIILGPIYLCLPIIFLYKIRLLNQGFDIILWFLIIVWSTDSFSYVFGNYFGGKKLWVSLSPNKTWSGFLLGILAGSFISIICFYIKDLNLLNALLFGFILSFFTQFGDLFESWIKRKHLVKDSGKLIPGHGGILDRLDGLMISSIVLYIGCKLYA